MQRLPCAGCCNTVHAPDQAYKDLHIRCHTWLQLLLGPTRGDDIRPLPGMSPARGRIPGSSGLTLMTGLCDASTCYSNLTNKGLLAGHVLSSLVPMLVAKTENEG